MVPATLRQAVCAAGLVLLVVPVAYGQQSLSKAEISKRGKAATALVELRRMAGLPGVDYPPQRWAPAMAAGFASAFCIHPSGIFVTADRKALPYGMAGQFNLVVDVGLKTQKVIKAHVIRIDRERELVLLQAETGTPFPSLTLGSSENLSELAELVSFGYASAVQPPRQEKYPPIQVNLVTVTALEQKKGALQRIEFNTPLNAGIVGGPLLDSSGLVVGVMAGSQFAAGVNAAIPVDHIRSVVKKPVLQFTPPTLTLSNYHRPTAFQVRVVSLVPLTSPLSVELRLLTGAQAERRFPMEAMGDTFRVTAAPVPEPDKDVSLRLRVRYGNDSLSGGAADFQFKIGDRALKLSEVRQLRLEPQPRAVLRDGTTLEGSASGLDAVTVRIGGAAVRLNLARAVEVDVDTPPNLAVVAYRVVASQAGKVVEQVTGPMIIQGGPGLDSFTKPGTPPSVALGDKTVVKLPAPVADLVVGGAGRFLILYLATVRKLAIFDVRQAKVVHYLPLAEDNVKFAAGKDKLIIILPTSKVIQRWDLATFEREASAELPVKGVVKAISMGSAASDLLLVYSAAGTEQLAQAGFNFVSVHSLKIVDNGPIQQGQYSSYRDLVHIRASPDGRVYGLWCTSHSPHGLMSIVVSGTAVKSHYEHTDVDHVVPGPDDRFLFTGRGLYTLDGKPLAQSWVNGVGNLCVPSQEGPFYLNLGRTAEQQRFAGPYGRPSNDVKAGQGLWIVGDAWPLLALPDVSVPAEDFWIKHDFTIDKRFHLLPEAKLLITIPTSNDQLVLHRFDIEAALERAGIDYLWVTSRPPARVATGTTFTYRVAVKSRDSNVKYKLEAGPPGMAVSPAGIVTWQVPEKAGDTEVPVIVSIREASGQECFHAFTLNLRE
jgi:hypothetical protein